MAKKSKEEMISSMLLQFRDSDVHRTFRKDKQAFYMRAFPVLALILVLLSASREVVFRVLLNDNEGGLDTLAKNEQISLFASIFNWVVTAVFISLCFCVRITDHVQYLACPLLTWFIYFYLGTVVHSGTPATVYYAMCIGIPATFYILVMLSEMWLLSTLCYAPCIVYFMFMTGQVVRDTDDWLLLTLRCLFDIFVYASVAYKVELLQKQNFLGRDCYQKSFKHWLKIFDTFTEGVAVLANDGSIVYSNSSIRKHLQFDQLNENHTSTVTQNAGA
jgi:hypothetical protein